MSAVREEEELTRESDDNDDDDDEEDELSQEDSDGSDVQNGDSQEVAEIGVGTDEMQQTPHGDRREDIENHAVSVDSLDSPRQRSRAPSPTDSLIEHTSKLQLQSPTKESYRPDDLGREGESDVDDGQSEEGEEAEGVSPKLSRNDIKERISSDIARQRIRQTNKYHSKRSTRRVGRPKGSKAKQDTRIKADRGGVWE